MTDSDHIIGGVPVNRKKSGYGLLAIGGFEIGGGGGWLAAVIFIFGGAALCFCG
jgi:hypothetical protein